MNPGRGEETARADTEEVANKALVERLRRLEWPTPEAGHAERAFERFKAAVERADKKG